MVPDGFGVAYMTGYDGKAYFNSREAYLILLHLDRLQYTITSRKEMPNAQFCKEIARAAEDLYNLHADGGKSRL